MYALVSLSITLLAGQATASAALTRHAALANFLKRDVIDPSEIPAQCDSQCDDPVNSLNTCTTVACLCSSSVNTGLYNCLECALSLDPDVALLDEAQDSLSDYELTCGEEGVPVSALVLTLPAASATATGSPTTTVVLSFSDTLLTTPTGSATATDTAAGTDPTETEDEGTTTTDSSGSTEETGSSDPLARKSGAGAVGVSVAVVAGVVGAACAMLAL